MPIIVSKVNGTSLFQGSCQVGNFIRSQTCIRARGIARRRQAAANYKGGRPKMQGRLRLLRISVKNYKEVRGGIEKHIFAGKSLRVFAN